jgi:hypothetical protein
MGSFMGGPRGRPQLRFFGSRLGTLRVLPAQNGGPIGVTPGTLVRAKVTPPPLQESCNNNERGRWAHWAAGLIGAVGLIGALWPSCAGARGLIGRMS